MHTPVVILLPYDTCSGLELFGLRFAADLISKGHQAIIAAPDNSLLAKQCEARNLPRFHFPVTYKYELSSYPAAIRLLAELKPAAVIGFRTQMMYPVHLARLLTGQKMPFFLFYRIGAGRYHRKDPLHRRLFNNLAAVVPNADHVKNRILDYWGISPEKVICIKSGVDTEKYYPDIARRSRIRSELHIDDNAVLIGSSGRIHPEKGSEILLRTLFAENGPGTKHKNVHLAYVGREYKPGYADHLRRVAVEIGAGERFHILGFRNDVETVYAGFDLFAFAVTSSEAYAYVVLEAMASGVVPVVPTSGGLVEMFDDGVEGFFFRHNDSESLKTTLFKAVELGADARTLMGKACRKRIENHASWQMMMQTYLDLFRKSRVKGF